MCIAPAGPRRATNSSKARLSASVIAVVSVWCTTSRAPHFIAAASSSPVSCSRARMVLIAGAVVRSTSQVTTASSSVSVGPSTTTYSSECELIHALRRSTDSTPWDPAGMDCQEGLHDHRVGVNDDGHRDSLEEGFEGGLG